MKVEDIMSFFSTSSREDNDSANKIRENILTIINDPPIEYINDIEYSSYWKKLHDEWNNVIKIILINNDLIPENIRIEVKILAGRSNNYDANLYCYSGDILVKTLYLEFKNGGFKLPDLPQILSLQVKFGLIEESYDKFYYENYLDKYLLCDTLITEVKPSLEIYLKNIISVNYNISPFFAQLKKYEENMKDIKNNIVNESIKVYLQKYANQINIQKFTEKLKISQINKIFILWQNEKFYIDQLNEYETNDIVIGSITNNSIILTNNTTKYKLLLRWRNHKGILNPAWQISMKRIDTLKTNELVNDIINKNTYSIKEKSIINKTSLSKMNLVCEKCQTLFINNSSLQRHLKRKTPCETNIKSKEILENKDNILTSNVLPVNNIPDFRQISIKFNKSLSKEKRKKGGIYFTPKSARDHLFHTLTSLGAVAQTVLEPSFGSGEFIYDAQEHFPDSAIDGVEINEDMFNEVSAQKLARVALYNADFIEWQANKQYDLIIGNPPYFVMKSGDLSASAKEIQKLASNGRTNIFVLFLYKCLQLLAKNGVLSFIIPTSIYNCSYYQPIRTYIANNTTILHLETLQDIAFHETNQETCLIIIRKSQSSSHNYIFTSSNLAFISPFYKDLILLSSAATTISQLGLSVKTGSIVWNQCRNELRDNPEDGTLLIYSSNIVNSTLVLGNLNGANDKKQYIKSNKETIKSPVVLVSRGYGNSYSFNSVYIDLDQEFYAENHVNVIYAKTKEAEINLKLVYDSLNSDKTLSFIRYFIGNGSLSSSDLENIVPI